MNPCPPVFDEPLATVRGDATLRALAELDSLEPPRALDRAVLGRAREAAANRRARRTGAGRALRWGFPAAVAAAAVCAFTVHRTASRPGTPRAPNQLLVWRTHASPNNALEMVRVSVRYRGVAPRVGAAATSAFLTVRSPGESPRLNPGFIPSFLETSVPLLSIRTAPLHKRGQEERTPRAAMRSSERGSRRERESTARRRIRPLELIDSIDSLEVRPAPPPPPAAAQSAVGWSSPAAQLHDARAEAAPAGPH